MTDSTHDIRNAMYGWIDSFLVGDNTLSHDGVDQLAAILERVRAQSEPPFRLPDLRGQVLRPAPEPNGAAFAAAEEADEAAYDSVRRELREKVYDAVAHHRHEGTGTLADHLMDAVRPTVEKLVHEARHPMLQLQPFAQVLGVDWDHGSTRLMHFLDSIKAGLLNHLSISFDTRYRDPDGNYTTFSAHAYCEDAHDDQVNALGNSPAEVLDKLAESISRLAATAKDKHAKARAAADATAARLDTIAKNMR